MALEKIKYKAFKPRLLFKFKLEASPAHFILYFLGRQKQFIFNKNCLFVIFELGISYQLSWQYPDKHNVRFRNILGTIFENSFVKRP
jgi:hypothetical protein